MLRQFVTNELFNPSWTYKHGLGGGGGWTPTLALTLRLF